jgi:hypothetical protein
MHTSRTSSPYDSHLQYPQQTPLHFSNQGFFGPSEGEHSMDHERIPRSTSYLFLSVSLHYRALDIAMT